MWLFGALLARFLGSGCGRKRPRWSGLHRLLSVYSYSITQTRRQNQMEKIHTNADGNIKYFTTIEYAQTRCDLLNATATDGQWEIKKANNNFFYIEMEAN